MQKRRTFVAIALVVLRLLLASIAAAAGTAIARPDPLVSTVAVGQTFTVNLYLQDIADAYGADIRMCFDPTVLEAQDADPFTPGIQIQPLASFMSPGFVIKKEASNMPDPSRDQCKDAGFVWYAFTQLNPTPPASGSGPIAAVTFKALKAGASPLTVAYQKASTRNGVEIPTMPQNGSVQAGGATEQRRIMLPIMLR